MRLPVALARKLVLRSLGYRTLPTDEPSELRDYDGLLKQGYHLAFYRRGDAHAVRPIGGPPPRLTSTVPPERVDDWELIGVHRDRPLFGPGWRRRVQAMPADLLLGIWTVGETSDLRETLLYRRGRCLIVQTTVGDVSERVELGAFDIRPTLETTVGLWAHLLTIPPSASTRIVCDQRHEHRVVDAIGFTTEPTHPMEGLADSLDWAVHLFKELHPVDITVNEIPHLAARVDERWTLIPMDEGTYPAEPRTVTELAHTHYSFDGGGPGGNGYGGETVGLIRPGLVASWNTYDEGVDCVLTLSTGDPIAFAAAETCSWPLYEALVHGTQPDLDCYEGSWHLDPAVLAYHDTDH